MLRQFTKQKPTKGNENDVEGPIINRGNKQFGPSGKNLNSPLQRPDSPALKLKPNNQKEIKSNKSDNQKLFKQHGKPTENTNIPQKRTNVSLQQQQEAVKKQHISPVETTHRRREEEIEWTPAGLDLDLNAFDNAVEEYHSHRSILDKDIFEEGFPVIERQFKKDFIPVEPVFEVENETDTPALNIEEEPTSVEYGPPKEEEIPFAPNENCIVDFNNFGEDADLDAYELSRHLQKDTQFDISLYEDDDVLKLQQYRISDPEFFDLECTVDDDSDFSSAADFSSIPYYDYELDIEQLAKCN